MANSYYLTPNTLNREMSEPLDLKKTVNLPKTAFSQKANLGQSEPARLKKWKEIGLYDQVIKAREGREKFILHDGPPYANADIHIGTALNKILKDFVVKTRSMMGYEAPYVPGYDCHGLPIENLVEKKLAAKGKNKSDLPVSRTRRTRDGRTDARFPAPRHSRRMADAVPDDVAGIRIIDRSAVREVSRTGLRLQRAASRLLVHIPSDRARRS
jgi:hypothetical protein